MKPSLKRRLALGAAQAKVWLDGLDPTGFEVAPKALYEIALRISERRMCLHEVVEGSGAAMIRWRSLTHLVQSTRPALVRLLLRGNTAGRVQWSIAPGSATQNTQNMLSSTAPYHHAGELGALGLSYAREQDLAIACAILQFAGRLRSRHPLLDEVACFVLDQQVGAGPFGLVPARDQVDRMKLLKTQLRYTVDCLAALDSYLLRSQ